VSDAPDDLPTTEGRVLAHVRAAEDVLEYRLQFNPTDPRTLLTVQFSGPAGNTMLRFRNPWPLEASFALTDDRGDVVVTDIAAHQLEVKKVKVEFFTEAQHEFWADAVEVIVEPAAA
jgi:hypothetical protein